MNRLIYLIAGLFVLLPSIAIHAEEDDLEYGSMMNWTSHFAYGNVRQVVNAEHLIYALADGAMFSIDPSDESMEYYSKMTGLSGSTINLIDYDYNTKQLVVLYDDGLVDLIRSNGRITPIQDLSIKQMNASKKARCIYIHEGMAYLGMDFGIVVLNLKKQEVLDTYYIGDQGSEVAINSIALLGDTIFATDGYTLYKADIHNNLLDYSYWQHSVPPSGMHIADYNGQLFALAEGILYIYERGEWKIANEKTELTALKKKDGILYALSTHGFYKIEDNRQMTFYDVEYEALDVCFRNATYYLAIGANGVVGIRDGYTQIYYPNGPYENFPYRIRFRGDKMIVVPGGYWASPNKHPGNVMVFENGYWQNYSVYYMMSHLDGMLTYDYSDAAIDPEDPSHFFIASCGAGLFEFRNNEFYMRHMHDNSAIDSMFAPENFYTWVDGLTYDNQGNLWMTNMLENHSPYGVKVLKKDGSWVKIANKACSNLNRTHDLLIWNQDPAIKIITNARLGAGIGVWNDHGTIEQQSDDRAVFIKEFVDQKGKQVTPTYIYSICQTKTGALWVGTEAGIFIIDDPRELLNGSKLCRRVIINRTDDSGLADYLLGTEQVNAIAEDGVGRIWLGTASSGLYLVSQDGKEIIHHFTIDDSPIPSDNILSLAIRPSTGEVFIGTGAGLVSFQSDASEPKPDFSTAYAYPNPVPPDYAGYITITGLMDESVIYIVDNGGNLVCQTHANGGLAVWDGLDGNGNRVASGMYTAMCNTADGQNHTIVKILVMN